VTLFATERVPSPLAITAVVSNDLPNRRLTVRISGLEQGVPRLLWKESYAALRRSEESGWRTAHPTIWAATERADKVASALAGDNTDSGRLVFSFAPGEEAYAQLISKPVTALVVYDRSRRRFLSVKCKNRRD
jgi:hypothetical protein